MGADSSAAQIAASAILINSLIYRISQTNPLYQINEYEIQAPTSLISHPFRRGRQGRHTLNLACSWLWCWRHPFLCSRSASKKQTAEQTSGSCKKDADSPCSIEFCSANCSSSTTFAILIFSILLRPLLSIPPWETLAFVFRRSLLFSFLRGNEREGGL